MKQLLKTGIYHAARWSGLMPRLRRSFAAPAVILMFHEIQRDCRSELMTGTSVALFENSLHWLRQEGWEFVSLETCLDRLATDAQQSPRYAVITFDDGYRDNIATALPILERHDAPFTMYVPTGALTRTLQSWWLGLRELFRSHDTVAIDAMCIEFRCPDHHKKMLALRQVARWVHEDYTRVAMLVPTFSRAGLSLSALNEAYFLDERQLQVLARHPLASIGGHTDSHPALACLDAVSAQAEMSDNRNYLQNLIQSPVRHFAYPYGDLKACGPREELLARDLGFSTAVTTQSGQLAAQPLNHFALPRMHVDSEIAFEARMNGLHRAFLGDASFRQPYDPP
jgi:peptidoglycan/xylan/chitin deacetylase (PgdA/CDA1 family)